MAVGLRELWSDSAQRRPASFQLTPGISRACSQQLEPLLTSIQYKTGMIIKGYILPKKAGNKGEFRWTSGLQYTGEYKDNKREGYGEVVWPDGSRYEGYFHHDVREGHGKHTWGDSGEVYEGEYHNDKRHGQGTYKWPSGAIFTGYFANDLKVGKGVFISSQGEKFEGVYNSEREGEGILTYPGGKQDIGIWQGPLLVRLKFPIREIDLSSTSSSQHLMKSHLLTPDMRSRGKHGPKGHLEVASQELIQDAGNGDLLKVKAIFDTGAVHIDVVDNKGHSALFASAINGHCDVVDYILDNGADVNQLDDSGTSVLSACHHVAYSSHPKVKTLLDQLQSAIEKNRSSSEASTDGDTETLFTSDFTSTPQITASTQEGEHDDSETGATIITRSRSLDDLASPSHDLGHNHLCRVKSLPLLCKSHGDCLRSSQDCMERSLLENSVKSKGAHVDFYKTDDIMIEKLRNSLSFGPAVMDESNFRCSSEHETVTQGIGNVRLKISVFDSTESPSASANGEILGMSALNSDVSLENTACETGEKSSSNLSKTESNTKLKPSSSNSGTLSSPFPDIPQLRSRSRTSSVTPTSELTCHSKSLNVGESNSPSLLPPSPQLKKHLTKTALGLVNIYGSSVFSFSQYGPIVSAAQSTTLSVVDVDQDMMSDDSSTSTPSTIYAQKSFIQCASEKNMDFVIKLLLSRGSDPNISSVPLQPLFYSVLVGDVSIARKMLEYGADPNHCLPDELGGYSLLHVTVGNIGTYTQSMVELLLEYGADPDYGGGGRDRKKHVPHQRSSNNSDEKPDSGDEDEEKGLIAGENGGGTDVTPLHVVCGVEVARYSKDRELLSSLVPWIIGIFVKHGADVNKVANGYSPLSLAILRSHDRAIEALLEHGADPNIPLGKAAGNALCALTTHTAHRIRAFTSTSSSLVLLHKLMMKGGNIFSPVRLHNGEIGTAIDFAHAAFKEDKRLNSLNYGSLTKSERTRYRSCKKLMTFLRNIFRCKALQSCASKEEWKLVRDSILTLDNENVMKAVKFTHPSFLDPNLCINTTNNNSNNNSGGGEGGRERRLSMSAGANPIRTRFQYQFYLPEITLNSSLNALNKVREHEHEVVDDDDVSSVKAPPARSKKLNKDREKLPKQLRYKALFEKAAKFLSTYKELEEVHSHGVWTFSSFCYECGKCSSTNLTLCPNCEVVSYCSRFCKGESWKKGHKDECKRLTYTLTPPSGKSGKKCGVQVKRPQSCS